MLDIYQKTTIYRGTGILKIINISKNYIENINYSFLFD